MLDAISRLVDLIEDTRFFTTPGSRRRFLVHVVVATSIGIVALAVAWPRLRWLGDVDNVRSYVASYGAFAPAVLVFLQAAQVVFAPVPGQPLGAASGYLFGTWWGTAYSMIGIVLGSTVAFWVARRLGRPYVEGIINPDIIRRFDAIDEGRIRTVLFVLFLVPGLPDDAICFLGGLTKVPLSHLVAIALVGRLPAFFMMNLIGDLAWAEAWLLVGVLLVAFIGFSVVGFLHREWLIDRATALANTGLGGRSSEESRPR
ncbi:MAG: TVP38/TMEM64 family protein [Halobacteriales archaeon]